MDRKKLSIIALTSLSCLLFQPSYSDTKQPSPPVIVQPVAPASEHPQTEPNKAPESSPSLEQPKEEQTPAPTYEHALVKMLVTLLALIFLVVLTIWLLKRMTHGRLGAFGSQKKIRILERRPLSPKSVLYLVQIGTRQVLVAESQLEVKALTALESVEETEE